MKDEQKIKINYDIILAIQNATGNVKEPFYSKDFIGGKQDNTDKHISKHSLKKGKHS